MLRIAGFAVLVLTPIFGVTHAGDLRDLYNQMYPVNALKRDAFDLCHESDPTFVRALDDDRESCYGRMPHNIALAIGYVRPDAALAASDSSPAAERAAMLLLADATIPIPTPPRPPAAVLAALILPPSPGCGEATSTASAAPARLMRLPAAIASPIRPGAGAPRAELAMLAAIGAVAPAGASPAAFAIRALARDAASLSALPIGLPAPPVAAGECGIRA